MDEFLEAAAIGYDANKWKQFVGDNHGLQKNFTGPPRHLSGFASTKISKLPGKIPAIVIIYLYRFYLLSINRKLMFRYNWGYLYPSRLGNLELNFDSLCIIFHFASFSTLLYPISIPVSLSPEILN